LRKLSKGDDTISMWNHRKRELRKNMKKGFSKMAVSETQMEMRTFMYQQLHCSCRMLLVWTYVYLVKLRLKDF